MGVRAESDTAQLQTPTGSLTLATSPVQGEDKQNPSRGALSRPSYAGTKQKDEAPGLIFVRWRRRWNRRHRDQARISRCFVIMRSVSDKATDDKKRKAERRKALFRNRRALRHGARLVGALASRRSTTALTAATERHRSARATRLPGHSFGAHAPIVRKTCASQHTTRSQQNRLPCVTRGRYPRLAVPVQRDCTRRPVVMPVGRVLPKPPESQGDEP